MKKLFVILLTLSALLVRGETQTFRNIHNKLNHLNMSFRMAEKLNRRAGVFVPHYERGKDWPGNKSSDDPQNIVIVGRDLSKMADGDYIYLKDRETLYRIGTISFPNGVTYAVYSFNRKDTVAKFLPPTQKSTVIRCPHCGKEIKVPAK